MKFNTVTMLKEISKHTYNYLNEDVKYQKMLQINYKKIVFFLKQIRYIYLVMQINALMIFLHIPENRREGK